MVVTLGQQYNVGGKPTVVLKAGLLSVGEQISRDYTAPKSV